jgi:hypothetical protein
MSLGLYRPEFKAGLMKVKYEVEGVEKSLILSPLDLDQDLGLELEDEDALKASAWGKHFKDADQRKAAKAERKAKRKK